MSLDQNEIKKLLEGVELEEGAVTTLTALVEKALTAKTDSIRLEEGKKLEEANAASAAKDAEIASLKEQMATIIEKADEYGKMVAEETRKEVSALAEEYGKYVQQETAGRLNEYAKYAVSEFIKEQKDQFVQLDEYNRMKHAFNVVKESFERNGFQVDTSKELTEARQEVTTAKDSFNSLYKELQEAKKELETAQQTIIFNEMTAGLTDTQKERITNLSENVKFNGVDEFRSALKFMVETVTKEPKAATKPAGALTESRSEPVDPNKGSSLVAETLKYL